MISNFNVDQFKLLSVRVCLTLFVFASTTVTLHAAPPQRDGTRWVDSIGADILDSAVIYSLLPGTLIFHASVDRRFFGGKNTFFSVDYSQSVMHNRNMVPVTDLFNVHVFRIKNATNLRLINPYSKTFANVVADNGGVNPIGQRSEETEKLAQHVCNSDDYAGWRSPWDQDEIMLCANATVAKAFNYLGSVLMQQGVEGVSGYNAQGESQGMIGPTFSLNNGNSGFAIRNKGTRQSIGQIIYFDRRKKEITPAAYGWQFFYNIISAECSPHITPKYEGCTAATVEALPAMVEATPESLASQMEALRQDYNCRYIIDVNTPYFGSDLLIMKTDDFKDNLNREPYMNQPCEQLKKEVY